jgi:hypothetical protein
MKDPKPLLLLELVPAPNWGWNLRSELTRTEWDAVRQTIYSRAGNRCEICGGKGKKWPVECHEQWDYDDEAGVQRLVGLEALCPPCHEVRHMGRAVSVGNGERAARHMEKVNGWTPEQVQAHVDEAFDVWHARSRRAWQLDVSWLAGFLHQAEANP